MQYEVPERRESIPSSRTTSATTLLQFRPQLPSHAHGPPSAPQGCRDGPPTRPQLPTTRNTSILLLTRTLPPKEPRTVALLCDPAVPTLPVLATTPKGPRTVALLSKVILWSPTLLMLPKSTATEGATHSRPAQQSNGSWSPTLLILPTTRGARRHSCCVPCCLQRLPDTKCVPPCPLAQIGRNNTPAPKHKGASFPAPVVRALRCTLATLARARNTPECPITPPQFCDVLHGQDQNLAREARKRPPRGRARHDVRLCDEHPEHEHEMRERERQALRRSRRPRSSRALACLLQIVLCPSSLSFRV